MSLTGFAIEGMEPIKFIKNKKDGVGCSFFFSGNYIKNELRVPIGPKRINLPRFAFLSIG